MFMMQQVYLGFSSMLMMQQVYFRVQFYVDDATSMGYPDSFYNVVYR